MKHCRSDHNIDWICNASVCTAEHCATQFSHFPLQRYVIASNTILINGIGEYRSITYRSKYRENRRKKKTKSLVYLVLDKCICFGKISMKFFDKDAKKTNGEFMNIPMNLIKMYSLFNVTGQIQCHFISFEVSHICDDRAYFSDNCLT